jgi:hypothetical protein
VARFVVLKGGVSYKVFEFEGNIARIGSGETMDLNLDTPGLEGDLFFLTKTPRGYEIERRNDTLSFNINGAPAGNRVPLNDGDKVAFLDYLIVATYPPSLGAPSVEPQKQAVVEPLPSHPVQPKDTSPALAIPVPPPPPKPEPPRPEPPKPAQRVERATTIIDSAAMAQAARPVAPPPPIQRDSHEQGARPVERPDARSVDRPATPAPRKPRVTAVYSLVGLSGQYKGQVREIDTREFVVGRDTGSCDLVIDRTEAGDLDNSVSREHFTIIATDEGLSLTDKKSRLRTYVNGKVLEPNQRESIAPEDVISIPVPTGEVKFRLCFVGNENFAPDKGRSKYLPLIIGLAIIITLLIVAAIWLLGD